VYFQDLLKGYGMRSSMSRKANCWDNAPTESLWGIAQADAYPRPTLCDASRGTPLLRFTFETALICTRAASASRCSGVFLCSMPALLNAAEHRHGPSDEASHFVFARHIGSDDDTVGAKAFDLLRRGICAVFVKVRQH
jgi:transposase InsO family protein